jgi:protein-tyrosine-phosphatase
MMNILFICKHNRFRSKVAEALFKKYAPKYNVKSAGIELDVGFPYVASAVKKVLKEYGVKRVEDKPQLINPKIIKWADKIIVIADDVALDKFPEDKTEVWPIQDCHQDDEEGIRVRVKDIYDRVRKITSRP